MCSGQLLLGTGECEVDSFCWVMEKVYMTVATVGYWRMCSGQLLLLGTGECVVDSNCWVLENV